VHGVLIASNPILMITLLGLIGAPLEIFDWNPWYYPIPTILWIILPFLLFIDIKNHPNFAWVAIISFSFYHFARIIFIAIDEKGAFFESWIFWWPHLMVCLLTISWIINRRRRTNSST
jgi:uncharacterized membrane protein YoaK (UPF0700 family)